MAARPPAGGRRRARTGRGGGLEWGLALGVVAAGLGLLRVAPVVVYACPGGAGSAACVVEWRWGGVLVVDRVEVGAIASATPAHGPSARTERPQQPAADVSEALSGMTFYGTATGAVQRRAERGDRKLRQDNRGPREHARDGRAPEPLLAWQAPWLPLLLASLLLLLGVPMLTGGCGTQRSAPALQRGSPPSRSRALWRR